MTAPAPSVAECVAAVNDAFRNAVHGAIAKEEGRQALERLTKYVERAEKTLGPECPKCGHFLKAEHERSFGRELTNERKYFCGNNKPTLDGDLHCNCRFTMDELRRDHPDIASAFNSALGIAERAQGGGE